VPGEWCGGAGCPAASLMVSTATSVVQASDA
jgi:hypothetical protein